MKRKRHFPSTGLLPLLLVPALGLFGACASSEADPDSLRVEEVPQNVRVLELASGNLEEYLLLNGPLRAVRATDVATEETGVVRHIRHDKGERVAAGEVILELDRDLLEAELRSAEAAFTLRQYNEERTRTLYDANSVSKQEMLLAYTEMEQARQAVERARLRYERAAIKAPFEGIVADRLVELGQMVSPGTVVTRVVDPFTLKLQGWVTEREILRIEVGAPALVALEGMDRAVEGRVEWVGIEADPTTGKFGVELRVDNARLQLHAGVVARARVLKRVHRDVISIPRDAVVQGPAGPRVFVVEEEHARPRDIRLGAGQGLMVIVEQGLRDGEQLVVRGQRELNPGSKVIVQEESHLRDGSLPQDPPVVTEEGSLEDAGDFRGEEGATLSGGSR